MKGLKKIVSILVVSFILISLISACKNSKETGNKSTPGGKTKISIATWVTGSVDKDSYVEQEIEKLFPDVDIEFLCFERAIFKDQLNTRIAGGEIPDIIYRTFQDEVTQYARQGILAEIPYETIKKYAPNIYSDSIDFGTEVWLATMYDGKNYGVPALQDQSKSLTNGWRKDWLDNVGITKIPETIEEYEKAFDKFVNEDPDKNGKKDTYALSARGMDMMDRTFLSIFGAYGTYGRQWITQEDGTVKEGSVTNGARKALETLARWYKKGYIDPEFVTTDVNKIQQKWINGKIGFVEDMYYNLSPPSGPLYKNLKAVSPKAEIEKGPAPKGPEGKYGYMSQGKITSSLTFGKHLEKDTEKLKRSLQLIDRITADKDVFIMRSKGVEGTHFKYDENGYTIKIPPYDNNQNLGQVGTLALVAWPATQKVQDEIAPKTITELQKFAIMRNFLDGRDYHGWMQLFFTPDDKKLVEELSVIRNKWFIEIITGSKTIEQFEQFVDEWNKAGGDKLTKRANEIFVKGKKQVEYLDEMLKK